MSTGWIVLGVVVLIALFLVMIYNRLVALRQNRTNAYSDIDVQLRQRLDTIPNLIETVKGYAGHEKGVLENITKARARIAETAPATAERMKAEGQMSQAMMNLFAVAENYPDLKANQNFLHLQSELTDLENKIAAARRYFNNATGEYNTAIQQFPAVLFAPMLGFGPEPFFEMPAEIAARAGEPPKVSF